MTNDVDPFAEWSTSERAALSDWVTGPLDDVFRTRDQFDLLRVLCGEKPGTYLTVSVDPETNQPVVDKQYTTPNTEDPRADIIDAFLDEYDLAYRCDTGKTVSKIIDETGAETARELTLYRYYIAADADRVAALSEDPDDAELGEFLGYPQSATDAYVNDTTQFKNYRMKAKAIHHAEDHPSALDYLYYYNGQYRAAPTVEGYQQQYEDARHNVALREAFDDALDVENRFSLQFYKRAATQTVPFNNLRLLWWLFYYQSRNVLSSPRNALGDGLQYLRWRLNRFR